MREDVWAGHEVRICRRLATRDVGRLVEHRLDPTTVKPARQIHVVEERGQRLPHGSPQVRQPTRGQVHTDPQGRLRDAGVAFRPQSPQICDQIG